MIDNDVMSYVRREMDKGRNSKDMAGDQFMKDKRLNQHKIAGVMASITRSRTRTQQIVTREPMFARNDNSAPEVQVTADYIRIKPGSVKNVIIDSDTGSINLQVGE